MFVVKYPDFAERMEIAAKARGGALAHRGRNAEVARRLSDITKKQVTSDTVRRWFEGYAMPRFNRLPAIAQVLDVDVDWLESGRGTMEPKKQPTKTTTITETFVSPALKALQVIDDDGLGEAIERLQDVQRRSAAANYCASVITMSGISASSNGSIIEINAGAGGKIQLLVDAISGEKKVHARRSTMSSLIVVMSGSMSPPLVAIIPASGLDTQIEIRVDRENGVIESDEGSFKLSHSFDGVLEAI